LTAPALESRLLNSPGNAPQFDLRTESFHLSGTYLTQIDGIGVTTR
jgi:hypothetical protein